jgi:DNA polymerase-3 subunit chi
VIGYTFSDTTRGEVGSNAVPDLLFYHLERDPLEQVLPLLLEKSLARGWRCAVQVGSRERMESLDTVLWTYRDESFLPHGTEAEQAAGRQPVLLTTADENRNDARIRFFVDGAEITAPGGYDRLVYMFNGHDDAATQKARETWKWAKAQPEGALTAVTYWRQNANGGWEQKA